MQEADCFVASCISVLVFSRRWPRAANGVDDGPWLRVGIPSVSSPLRGLMLLISLRLCGEIPKPLARVSHSGSNTVHGHDERIEQRWIRIGPAEASKQLDLHDVDRIDVRVANIDRSSQHGVRFEQRIVARDREGGIDSAGEAVAQGDVPGDAALPAPGDRIAQQSGCRLSRASFRRGRWSTQRTPTANTFAPASFVLAG